MRLRCSEQGAVTEKLAKGASGESVRAGSRAAWTDSQNLPDLDLKAWGGCHETHLPLGFGCSVTPGLAARSSSDHRSPQAAIHLFCMVRLSAGIVHLPVTCDDFLDRSPL